MKKSEGEEEKKIRVYWDHNPVRPLGTMGRSTLATLTTYPEKGCTVIEKDGDLFTSEKSLCHCVSKDFKMGQGIALEFKKRFGRVHELMSQRVPVGKVAYLRDGNRYLFYLVTKSRYWMKPTLDDLASCLADLRLKCQELSVDSLSMPRIGCGLDRLEWEMVKLMIRIFLGDTMTVTVYSLPSVKRNKSTSYMTVHPTWSSGGSYRADPVTPLSLAFRSRSQRT